MVICDLEANVIPLLFHSKAPALADGNAAMASVLAGST